VEYLSLDDALCVDAAQLRLFGSKAAVRHSGLDSKSRPVLRFGLSRMTKGAARSAFVIPGRSRPKAVAKTLESMPEKSRQRGEVRKGRRFCIAAMGRDAYGMDPRVKPRMTKVERRHLLHKTTPHLRFLTLSLRFAPG
jgi:hypothetical protein